MAIDYLFISRSLDENPLTGEIPSSIGNLVNFGTWGVEQRDRDIIFFYYWQYPAR
jgi:hypothetical protein